MTGAGNKAEVYHTYPALFFTQLLIILGKQTKHLDICQTNRPQDQKIKGKPRLLSANWGDHPESF